MNAFAVILFHWLLFYSFGEANDMSREEILSCYKKLDGKDEANAVALARKKITSITRGCGSQSV